MKRIMVILALCAGSFGAAHAQTGQVFGMESFPVAPMMDFSNFNYSMSTPRASAMGGAFCSLGADLASMSINPAGLGMYRRSEFGTTLSVLTNDMSPQSPTGLEYRGHNPQTRFVLNNMGMALNVYQGRGDVTSAQFGFGYNRLADLNYNVALATPQDNRFVAEIFTRQVDGFSSDLFEDNRNPFSNRNIDPSIWGGVMAWKTSLIDNYVDPNNVFHDNRFTITSIDPAAIATHYSEFQSRGYVGEFTISGAVNMQNKLYLGATISILSIVNDRYLYYGELYPDNQFELDAMQYQQWTSFTGSGVALKLGAIYRPIPELRIGLAFHTPYIVDLERRYNADMWTGFYDNNNGYSTSATLNDTYSYSTPPRLMAGVSYTFGQTAILSVDYERVWWNGMRLQNAQFNDILRDLVTPDLRGQDNLRVGAEIRPTAALALRAGATYTGSQLRNKEVTFDNPVAQRSASGSLGLGWRFSAASSLDATYIHSRTSYLAYTTYDLPGTLTSSSIKLHNNRNYYTLGFSTRF